MYICYLDYAKESKLYGQILTYNIPQNNDGFNMFHFDIIPAIYYHNNIIY